MLPRRSLLLLPALPVLLLLLGSPPDVAGVVRCSVHPLDPPGPSHPGSSFAAVACSNATQQLWALSAGVTPGDSRPTQVGQWHTGDPPAANSAAGGAGCWEIQGCGTGEHAVANTNYGCKALPAKPCEGSNDCLCNGAWAFNSNGTITSVMDGHCLQVEAGAGSAVTVGSCTGKPSQRFTFVENGARGEGKGFVWYMEQHGLCVQGAPPPPPHCASFATHAACPAPRCAWSSGGHCVDPPPPTEKCVTPKWVPTYNMSESTVVMPCNYNELMSSGSMWPTIREFGQID